MSRQLRAIALVFAGALVAAACSDPPTSGGGDQTEAGGDTGDAEASLPECPLDALDDADGPVEVTLWYGGIGGPTQQTMKDMVAGFNASQDQVRVTASSQGGSFEEVFRKFDSTASANTDQLPDIVMLENRPAWRRPTTTSPTSSPPCARPTRSTTCCTRAT
jgi:ABC-type glycerol-3-phosphate transport system substrate-binding protein